MSNGTDYVYMKVEANDSMVLMASGIDHTAVGSGNLANTIVAFTEIELKVIVQNHLLI